MAYGLRLTDTSGRSKVVTPDEATVISSGTKTMSNSLEGDNTYGEDISLGGTYAEDNLSVLVSPRRPNYNVVYNRWIDGSTLYYASWYLDDTATYYTRNTSTGVMTSYSAGNQTTNDKSTWNPVLSVFPIAFWDKMGASTFSSVRLFAATAYLFRDTHDDTNFSLSGTASATSLHGNSGPASNIKDDDTSTGVFDGCGVIMGNSCSWSYSAEVSFSSQTITKTEIAHRPWSYLVNGNYANGSYSVSLYFGSAWHEIFNGSWSGVYVPCASNEHIITYELGHWKGVTKIKVEASGSNQSSGSSGEASSEHVTHELRAWGPNNSNDTENKICYSIGDNGVDTVDYMVCRKRKT